MGIGRVNLAAKSVDFYTLGPATRVSFRLAPDRKVGLRAVRRRSATTSSGRSISSTSKLAGRTEFQGRPRMALKTSSNGKVLYINNAGNTIDLYDAATYQYLRTITLDGDMTTDLFVVPRLRRRRRASTRAVAGSRSAAGDRPTSCRTGAGWRWCWC